ncbi:unnamed protein product [Rotaria sp. Silwood1]|nr:unnamed protein product [Rotaria sp. Silwood1]CAF1666547.1 unnamed protein product [Rotaria sp. Silwood1]
MAEGSSMCYTYGRSKVLIKQRLQKYKLQCEKVQDAIHEHMKQIPPNIDMTIITNMINNLINNYQSQLRHELDRRKTMLRLDAEEHKLVDIFYNLKPRQTEIHSAKIKWKAIHEQQGILHEIAIFQKWLQLHRPASSCTVPDIPLPTINRIFTLLVINENPSSTEHMAKETIARAETVAKQYANIAAAEKTKLQLTSTNRKNVQLLDQIIIAIFRRENNMQQRGTYQLKRKVEIIFNQTQLETEAFK